MRALLCRAEDAATVADVDENMEKGMAQFRIWHDAVSPLTLGLEHVPPPGSLGGRPMLFVGNHTQFGLCATATF